MIKVLYVGGKELSIPELSGMSVHLDYVQNGMIALSAVQTGDFDAIVIEDQLPLMTPTRLLQELLSVNSEIPVVSVVRTNERRKDLLENFGQGLFSYFEPGENTGEEIYSILTSAKEFRDFKKDVPKTAARHF